MAVAVGFALAWMVVPTVGKRVFLLAVSAILTVMLCMTTAAATVKKAALSRKKSPPLAVQKQLLIGSPSPALPKGRESLLAVFKDVWWRSFPLERGFLGFSLVCTYATICIYDVV